MITILIAFILTLSPDANLTAIFTYYDIFAGQEVGVPDGTPVNLYQDERPIARKYTVNGAVTFEVTPGRYLADAVLGRADKTNWWVCRGAINVEEQQEYLIVQCRKVFLFFFPFIIPGRG